MKKIAVVAASLLLAGAASAADLSSPVPVKAVPAPEPAPLWDVAFGVKLATDYVFRGITQTDGNPAVQGYAELRLFDWIYGGVWASNVDFPPINQFGDYTGLTDASAEIDLYAGIRHTWGGLTLDGGFIYYYYPGEIGVNTLGEGLPAVNIDYWEIYFKPTYVINDVFTVGGNLYYTDSYAGSGSDGTYLSGTLKVDFTKWSPVKDVGVYVSGELGYQWLGMTDIDNVYYTTGVFSNYELPSYATWNVGIAFTYKAATLDLRYYGSELKEGYTWDGAFNSCGVISGLANACGDRFVASLSFDTTFLALK
ncbi:TorF family putative porin [Xanthobacter autotrophicus]|uniref:TorF family putative porin n=1 Tax=Xanthobacter TaxID=279 RepID=UPI0024ABCB14|nr:TorF family putative porin [Xanthobacter autotrophicus]MDI4664886.1 TorF family putative porin [Xanthobacter autotrophicus]